MKKLLLTAVAFVVALGVSALTPDEDYTLKKVSNPARGEREVDGLMAGGDRENSYTWRLAMRGDEIYIATTRNIASALVNMYASQFAASGISPDMLWGLIDAVTNGDIPRNDANEGANIIAYNRKTGTFRVVYTAEPGVYFRMAVTFGDNVYFGSYSANPATAQYILKLDRDGNFTKVFETMGSISLRANCVFDGHLFFAGADDREVVAAGSPVPTKMAVLRKSNDNDAVWDRVADYRDFGTVAFDPIMSSWAGAPIWELASHAGYIYATAPSARGFVIYRGHPAQGSEPANEYGWYWEEVAGVNNGINNPGLSDIEGGEPGTMRSLIGSVFEFKGELYAYNFDHSFGGEAAAFAGMLQQLAGKDIKASDYLFYMYNSLQNPQKVWKLDDESGKFVECVKFTELMEGTTNEYVWRMGEYDDQLYVATMDAGIFYGYLTQLTNGNLVAMTPVEMLTKIAYINRLIDIFIQAGANSAAAGLVERLEQLKDILEQLAANEEISDETLELIGNYEALLNEIIALLEQYLNSQMAIESDEFVTNALNGDINPADAETQMVLASAAVKSLPNDYVATECKRAKARLNADGSNFDEIRNALNSIISGLIVGALDEIKGISEDLYNRIDGKGIEMYVYINNTVRNNEWGFDLFRTSDGESFDVITRNGFNDKYNYGCPSFLATEEGLYIGTCNPFYGGQLYLLTNKNQTAITAVKQDGQERDDTYYTIDGRMLSGKPTAPGIYINGHKKVVVR